MPKKAQVSLTSEQIIGGILGFIIIVALFVFISNIMGVFTNKPEDATLNNFDALVLAVNQLVDAKDVPEEGTEIQTGKGIPITIRPNKATGTGTIFKTLFYVQGDYGIIGFDSETTKQKCGSTIFFFADTLTRPDSCLKKTCICLFKIGLVNNDAEDSSIKCNVIENVKHIYASKDLTLNEGNPYESTNYNYLAVWSQCASSTYGVREIEIQKIVENNEISLVFANPSG